MAIQNAFNLKNWIAEHRDQLKPPVGNAQVYKDVKDFIIMVVGGPNARKDYHYNESEEFYYQIEGDIVLRSLMKENQGISTSMKVPYLCYQEKHLIHRNVASIPWDW